MADTKQWRVMRRHMGDRFYEVGEIREASASEVKSLVGTVLEEMKTKAEPAPSNKAESAPANKAAPGRKAATKATAADKGE